jgi:hypothetical protein
MVAAWAAAVGLPDESMVTAVSSDEALDALPATLPALLSARLWRPSVGVVTEQLLSVLQTRSRQLDDSFHARVDKLVSRKATRPITAIVIEAVIHYCICDD